MRQVLFRESVKEKWILPSCNRMLLRNGKRYQRNILAAMSSNHHSQYDSLANDLRSGGFDVFVPMRVSWYNDYIEKLRVATDSTSYLEKSGETHASGEETAFKLAPLRDYGRQGNALAFFVGNSKALWPKFLRWYKDQPNGGAAMKDPLDTYASTVITDAMNKFAAVTGGAGNEKDKINQDKKEYDAFWASEMSPKRLVDMNRVALVTGTCHFSEKLFLSIHPVFGSWIAFRAVVVFDESASHLGPDAPSFLTSSSLISNEEAENAQTALGEALRASSEEGLDVDGMSLELAHKWVAMRDCISRGHEHKYSDLQSEYHYTKNPELLLRAISAQDLH